MLYPEVQLSYGLPEAQQSLLHLLGLHLCYVLIAINFVLFPLEHHLGLMMITIAEWDIYSTLKTAAATPTSTMLLLRLLI